MAKNSWRSTWLGILGGSILGLIVLIAWMFGRGYLRAAVVGPASFPSEQKIGNCRCYCMGESIAHPGYSQKLFQEDTPGLTQTQCQAVHAAGQTCTQDNLVFGRWSGCAI